MKVFRAKCIYSVQSIAAILTVLSLMISLYIGAEPPANNPAKDIKSTILVVPTDGRWTGAANSGAKEILFDIRQGVIGFIYLSKIDITCGSCQYKVDSIGWLSGGSFPTYYVAPDGTKITITGIFNTDTTASGAWRIDTNCNCFVSGSWFAGNSDITPTPTPTPVVTPSPTPIQTKIAYWSFQYGADNWSFTPIVNGDIFQPPASSSTAGRLGISPNNTTLFALGYWDSPNVSLTEGKYKARFRLGTDITPQSNVPEIRLRVTTMGGQVGQLSNIVSTGDSLLVPTLLPKDYYINFDLKGSSNVSLHFDLLRFDLNDSASGWIFLDEAQLDRR